MLYTMSLWAIAPSEAANAVHAANIVHLSETKIIFGVNFEGRHTSDGNSPVPDPDDIDRSASWKDIYAHHQPCLSAAW
jgi:hypothetical protein